MACTETFKINHIGIFARASACSKACGVQITHASMCAKISDSPHCRDNITNRKDTALQCLDAARALIRSNIDNFYVHNLNRLSLSERMILIPTPGNKLDKAVSMLERSIRTYALQDAKTLLTKVKATIVMLHIKLLTVNNTIFLIFIEFYQFIAGSEVKRNRSSSRHKNRHTDRKGI